MSTHAKATADTVAKLSDPLRYTFRRLSGRCSDGAERDGGTVYHVVMADSDRAVCGAKPGRRSAGWSPYHGADVTCDVCRQRLTAMFRRQVR